MPVSVMDIIEINRLSLEVFRFLNLILSTFFMSQSFSFMLFYFSLTHLFHLLSIMARKNIDLLVDNRRRLNDVIGKKRLMGFAQYFWDL